MSIALLLALVSLAALLGLWRVARGPSSPVRALQDLETRTIPVDLAAFRNLLDPEEEAFLRRQLPRRQLRAIQRRRSRAAMEYVKGTAHNAAVLLRLGEAARKSSDPAIAGAAQQLVEAAVLARLYAFLALAKLSLSLLLPGLPFSLGSALRQYERLRDSLTGLGRLQEPALAARICATL